jgi:drug/metabolite transporter (DMT)-like permease
MPATLKIATSQHSAVLGYLAALVAVVIISTYPAVTRVSVTTTLTTADLLMLRLGVSGLLFAPYLVWKASEIPARVWSVGMPLAFFHGWGMAGCVIFGLQFAPASHSVALGPGTISVWIAALGFLLYGINVHRGKLLAVAAIGGGVTLILAGSFIGLSTVSALTGDAMFLAASILGAAYLVYVQQHKLNPVLGVALVSTYSAAILLPWYLLAANSALATAPAAEIAWQIFFQGVLMGSVVFLALHYATLTIGSQTVGVLCALVPVLGMLASLTIANDPVSPIEWVAIAAISIGVAFGARPVPVSSRA